ncbi:type II 3-dehydroquinate dehydratase [Ectothiorhodospiraceae bacterium BW-2]|nr:type II 3-dehydroquinate dehydratase [Ectothiorhodospiraceae bacterium BW-2]
MPLVVNTLPIPPTLLLLNGPNLNLLGTREPSHYGVERLDSIVATLQQQATTAGYRLHHLQSNSETALIERIHQAREEQIAGIIINPAAFSHTSIALRDALSGVSIPFIEIHLSNIHAREPFRHHSYCSDIAAGVIVGLGGYGYQLALSAMIHRLETVPAAT